MIFDDRKISGQVFFCDCKKLSVDEFVANTDKHHVNIESLADLKNPAYCAQSKKFLRSVYAWIIKDCIEYDHVKYLVRSRERGWRTIVPQSYMLESEYFAGVTDNVIVLVSFIFCQ